MQKSLETRLQQAKDEKENVALQIFDSKGRIKATASPIKKRLYYKYEERVKAIQLELNRGEIEARKVQVTSHLEALGFSVGEIVKHAPTGVVGRVELDSYGYAILHPVDYVSTEHNRSVALYTHSMRDLRKV